VLEKPRALITGGASGIGEAITRIAIEAGWNVTVLDLRRPDPRARWDAVDLAQLDARTEWLSQESRLGTPYRGAVFCAGIQLPERTRFDAAVWAETLEVNVVASAHLAYGLEGLWRPGAGLVWLGSTASRDGSLVSPSYAASKAAIEGLMASFVRRFGAQGLRGAVLHPGATDTPLARRIHTEAGDLLGATPSVSHEYMRPEDVAAVAMDVLRSPVLSGISMRVDRGYRFIG
jgi:NAD(P)-dependent dehydrogenase (short-subunit alcohol dehydrogenase family)